MTVRAITHWSAFTATTLLLASLLVGAQQRGVEDIAQSVRVSDDPVEIRNGMQQLVSFNTAQATQAYAELVAQIHEKRIEPLPYLDLMFDFNVFPENADVVRNHLAAIPVSEVHPRSQIYVAGLRAKYGESEQVGWLIDKHRVEIAADGNASLAMSVIEVLSRVNVEPASDYVIDYVLSAGDLNARLSAEAHMRLAGNARSIDLMRHWPSIENGDFDLSVAQQYLASITAFGNEGDIGFLEWLDANGESYFHPDDVSTLLAPAIVDAKSAIASRSDQVWKGMPYVAMVAVFLVLLLGAVYYRRLRRV